MASSEDPEGVQTPASDSSSGNGHNDGYNEDPYSYAGVTEAGALTMTPSAPALPAKSGGGGGKLPNLLLGLRHHRIAAGLHGVGGHAVSFPASPCCRDDIRGARPGNRSITGAGA